MPISTIELRQESSYQIERVYGGQLRPRRMSNMGFEVGGVIQQVNIEEGQRVTQGQSLIILDQSALLARIEGAEAEAASAEATLKVQQLQLELSRSTLARNQQLASRNHVSEQLLDELSHQLRINEAQLQVAKTGLAAALTRINQIQTSLNKTVLRAPYEGIIQGRFVNEGSIIGPGDAALLLIEQDQLEAVIGVPESMVHLLEQSNDYEFTVNNRHITGHLKSLLPQVDSATGTVTAIFDLHSPNLFAGSLAEVRLNTTIFEPGFWIPLTAITESQRGLWSVFSAESSGDFYTVQPRLVEIIYQGKDSVYVRGSIEEGDLIINSGTDRVVPGQQVSVISQSSHRANPLSDTVE